MKDLGDMSKMPLTHYISAHLSVIYSTVVPVLLMVRPVDFIILFPEGIFSAGILAIFLLHRF
jgi:hypothetical protein